MDSQKQFTGPEIQFLLSCSEADENEMINCEEFANRFQEPAREIGFNVAVLLTNLSEHVPHDPRLRNFLELAESILEYFRPYLGRIEIMGASRRIERIYFEISETNRAQWEMPQVRCMLARGPWGHAPRTLGPHLGMCMLCISALKTLMGLCSAHASPCPPFCTHFRVPTVPLHTLGSPLDHLLQPWCTHGCTAHFGCLHTMPTICTLTLEALIVLMQPSPHLHVLEPTPCSPSSSLWCALSWPWPTHARIFTHSPWGPWGCLVCWPSPHQPLYVPSGPSTQCPSYLFWAHM